MLLGFNDATEFLAFISSIVTNQNSVLHIWSLESLEKDIKNATLSIELFLLVKEEIKNECKVVRCYDILKEQIPTIFK